MSDPCRQDLSLVEAIRRLQPNDHLCLLYESQAEQFETIIPFIQFGLARGEQCLYIADDTPVPELLGRLREGGIQVEPALRAGALIIASAAEVYLPQGTFDPERMIAFWQDATAAAKAAGYPALRVTGEMSWARHRELECTRLVEYESQVNRFFAEHEVLAICQYDRRQFPPDTLIDLIHSHPLVINGGTVSKNIYYVPPAEFLAPTRAAYRLERLLANLKERVRVEKTLKQAEQTKALILDNMSEYVVYQDLEHRIIWANRAAAESIGLAPEHLVGRLCDELWHQHTQKCADCPVRQAWKTGQPQEAEITLPGGRVGLMRACPVRDGEGELAGVVEVVLEITQRRRMEEALRQSEERYRQIFAHSPLGILHFDPNGVIVDCNDKLAEIMGSSREALLGFNLLKEVRDDAMRGAVLAALRGEIGQYEGTYLSVTGNKLTPMRVLYSCITSEAGELLGGVGIIEDITERQRAAETLRDSEQRYRLLVNTVPAVIFKGYLDWTVDFFDDKIEELTGYKKEEFNSRQRKWSDVILPEDLEGCRRAFVQSLKTDKAYVREYHIRHKEGHILWIHDRGQIICDPEGNVDHISGVFFDITSHKLNEEALHESEARFRNLLEYIPGISIQGYGTDGIVRYWNKASEEVYGYTAAEAIGKNLGDLIIPADLKPLFQQGLELGAQATKSGEFMPPGEVLLLHKDGSLVPVYSIHTVVCQENQPPLMFSFDVDLSERKRAEEALKESEERFRLLFEYAPDAYFLHDSQGNLISGNQAAEHLVGYRREELIGKNLLTLPLVAPEQKPLVVKLLSQVTRGQPIGPVEFRVTRKDGVEVLVEIRSYPVTFRGQPLVLGIARDITARRKMEEELSKASKLESLSLLAGGIAHDFNNLLHGILGNISLVLTMFREDSGNELYKRLSAAERACLQATDLTQQLLTFAKGGSPVKKPTVIAGLLKDSTSFALRGSNVRSEFSLPPDLWPVEVDEGQINQLIHNLIINADQAMPEGGTIRVSAENITVTDGSAMSLKEGRYVKISIRDQGIGIPKHYLGKIFDPYFTTKQKGSGLGLATSYSIIKNHGGHIAVDSEMDVGTTFDVYLPAAEQRTPSAQRIQERIITGQGRILVMDDEELVREVVGRMLEQIGYEAAFARDGHEAIELYRKAKAAGQPFTAVIMDLTIPGGMGGAEAVQILRKFDPGMKAIVSSGYADTTMSANFREYGFNAIIPKPYKLIRLSETLHQVIAEGAADADNAVSQ